MKRRTVIVSSAASDDLAGLLDYVMATQVIVQLKAVGLTILWSGIGSAILYKLVDLIIGLRPTVEQEREGLDVTAHGERAYNY